jgi:hypothetical protein
MSSEIIQNVAYDNYDNFQHVNVIFSQYFISLFRGLFNDETDSPKFSQLWCIFFTKILHVGFTGFLFFGRQVVKIHPKETLELSMRSI